MTTPERPREQPSVSTGEEALRARAETNRLIATNGIGLLETTIDVFDSLASDLLSGSLPHVEEAQLHTVHDSVLAFADLDYTSVTAKPRTPRPEDRGSFLPGQHQGINLQIATSAGDTAFINLYGGLRIVDEGAELRDSDRTLRRIHSGRTDSILSQPVHLNLHIRSSADVKLLDIWLVYNLNSSFSLGAVFDGDQRIDLSRQLPNSDQRFDGLAKKMSAHTKALTTLVPSA